MTIQLDYTNMLAPAVAGGIPAGEWDAAASAFRAAHETMRRGYSAGDLGFLDVPGDAAKLAEVERFVTHAPQVADVVLLGIGGSALGPVALRTALRPPLWNELPVAAREGFPRLSVLDNIDPVSVSMLLQRLTLPRTRFIVTSKSGGTAETMAQFLIVRDRLVAAGLRPAEHIVFVTDPVKGALRALAERENIPALEIPSNVGGRFSVLTPVGTLPAALIGIDVRALHAGAREMFARCESPDLARNPAGVYATLQWLAAERMGAHIHVMMPYADALRDFALWFVQLWAESLGKRHPDGRHVGPTPVAAVGASDQHSQVQLFMEGPADKTVTFISVHERSAEVVIPAAYPDIAELAYLGGHALGELIDVECRATAGALARRGRANMTIAIDRVDAWHVGGLMALLELATVYAGALYGVNPLDQPGVELGKQFAYAILGRTDAQGALAEWKSLPPPDPRRMV